MIGLLLTNQSILADRSQLDLFPFIFKIISLQGSKHKIKMGYYLHASDKFKGQPQLGFPEQPEKKNRLRNLSSLPLLLPLALLSLIK